MCAHDAESESEGIEEEALNYTMDNVWLSFTLGWGRATKTFWKVKQCEGLLFMRGI